MEGWLLLDERAADLLELGADFAQRFSIEQPCGGSCGLVLRPNAQQGLAAFRASFLEREQCMVGPYPACQVLIGLVLKALVLEGLGVVAEEISEVEDAIAVLLLLRQQEEAVLTGGCSGLAGLRDAVQCCGRTLSL